MQPDPVVGAVFLGGGTLHSCSGAVLDSAGGDLILTAAHCIADGVDATFVAGFNNDAAPEDVWHVDSVYLDPRWVQNQDPMADFAIARVSRDSGGTIQAQAGAACGWGPRRNRGPSSPSPATRWVTAAAQSVAGRHGQGDQGISVPALRGMVGGLSGAPWIDGSTVTGLIGGLDGGGCRRKCSYSPPFDEAITRLLARAEAGGPADDVPTVFDDDCD